MNLKLYAVIAAAALALSACKQDEAPAAEVAPEATSDTAAPVQGATEEQQVAPPSTAAPTDPAEAQAAVEAAADESAAMVEEQAAEAAEQ